MMNTQLWKKHRKLIFIYFICLLTGGGAGAVPLESASLLGYGISRLVIFVLAKDVIMICYYKYVHIRLCDFTFD